MGVRLPQRNAKTHSGKPVSMEAPQWGLVIPFPFPNKFVISTGA